MPLSQTIKDFITNAWADNVPCLLGTVGEDGPNVSPKGSLIFYDDDHLAYWERSRKKALENMRGDRRVIVVYANMKAQREGKLASGILRFYGTAELHEDGPVKDKIFSMLSKREQEHEGADKGFGVLIRIERAVDIHGKSIL
jgi:hypothetical protein